MELWSNGTTAGKLKWRRYENCIKKAEKFEDVKIEIYGSDYHFEDFNRKIKNGDYLIKK